MAPGSAAEGRGPNEMSMLASIETHARERPDHPAIIFEGTSCSYRQLVDRYRRMSRYFRHLGLGEGCRVCILSRNRPEYFFIHFATLDCGGTFFPINHELTGREVEYIVERASPHLIVIDDTALQSRSSLIEALGNAETCVISLSELMAAERSLPGEGVDEGGETERQPGSIALVVHTSGTTSNAKGVIATDRMEVASAKALREYWCMSPKDISLCALPLSYTFGLFTASYAPLSAGATVLLLDRFHPATVLEQIEKHRATMMVGVPTMFAMMANIVREKGVRYDTRSMRFFAASGAPVPEQTRKDFYEFLGHRLLDYYALSECTPIFSFDLRRADLGAKLSGGLVDGARVKIVDETGRPVENGEAGALFVASERLTPGYYKDAERTSQAIRNGWFETGDLAWQSDDGYYSIVGRTRDQIISGGHKIATVEIENILLQHPDVVASAVKGEPDALLGEIAAAFVVLAPTAETNDEQLLAFCRERLAPYKIPRKIVFRTSLPMSPAGKVLKREL